MKTLFGAILALAVSLNAFAEERSTTSTRAMVAGSSALTAVTLQSLIRGNSFKFTPSDKPGLINLSERIRANRFGTLALRNAERVTMHIELTSTFSAHRYALLQLEKEQLDLIARANASSSAKAKAALLAEAKQKGLERKALSNISVKQQQKLYGKGLPRTVEFTVTRSGRVWNLADVNRTAPNASGLPYMSDLDRVANKIALDCDAQIKNVRILTRFHNTRILAALKYSRNGVLAFGTIAALGLFSAEEGASALTSAKRNRELADMMREE